MNKVAATWWTSFEEFRRYIPGMELIKEPRDILAYDLIIFPGGEDVNPASYKKVNYASCDPNLKRDQFEIEVFKLARQNKKLIYGVCRGHQLINSVFFNGSLSQDLYFDGLSYHPHYHKLEWKDSKILAEFFKDEVSSTHHQGIISTSMRIIASFNNVIEACEVRNILTTQFHPEFMDGQNVQNFFNFLVNNWKYTEEENNNGA